MAILIQLVERTFNVASNSATEEKLNCLSISGGYLSYNGRQGGNDFGS
jgi:hypothetical protein